MMAKVFFTDDPFDLGVSGGFASPLAARFLGEADVVLSFSASLNTWTTRHGGIFSPSARIVHCDLDPSAIGRVQPVALGIVGDARATAEALVDELVRRDASLKGFRTDATRQEIAGFRWEGEFEDGSTAATMDPRTALMALEEVLPRERTVAVDCGHFAGFAAMQLSAPDAAGFVFAEAFQAVGLGMGAGTGAVLSPAISDVLRDATGGWGPALYLDAGIILTSFVLLMFVREPREEKAEPEAG